MTRAEKLEFGRLRHQLELADKLLDAYVTKLHKVEKEVLRLQRRDRDLKARLKAAAGALADCEDFDHATGCCDAGAECPVCLGYAATTLSVRNWRKL